MLAIIGYQRAFCRTAKAVSLLQNRIKDGRKIAGRAVDDAQYLGGRGLLLQGLARLGDQPRVLYCNDCLRGEVLQQRDLLVGERPHLLAVRGDDTQQFAILAQSDHDVAARAAEVDYGTKARVALAVD